MEEYATVKSIKIKEVQTGQKRTRNDSQRKDRQKNYHKNKMVMKTGM